jgi:hypothetical protein
MIRHIENISNPSEPKGKILKLCDRLYKSEVFTGGKQDQRTKQEEFLIDATGNGAIDYVSASSRSSIYPPRLLRYSCASCQ